jgi:predicted kinase
MPDLIVIAGAPGSGKTTIAKLLHARLDSVYVELGWLREFHLDPAWLRASPREEQMAFENLLFIVRNYFRYGYKNVIVSDLEDFRVRQIPAHFAQDAYVIATLVVHDETELKRRVLSPDRDSGYRDYEKALAWNRAVIERPAARNEYKINNTEPTPAPALEQIVTLANTQSPNLPVVRPL